MSSSRRVNKKNLMWYLKHVENIEFMLNAVNNSVIKYFVMKIPGEFFMHL